MKRISTVPTKSKVAASLVELMICAGIMTVILASVTMVLIRGLRFYQLHIAMQDAQRNAMLTLLTLAGDIQNTRSSLLDFNPQGVSFADPFNDANIFEFDQTTDTLYWNAYRTYYLDQRQVRYVRTKFPKTTNPLSPSAATPPVMPQTFLGTKNGKLLLDDVASFQFAKRTKQNQELQDLFIVNVTIGRKGDPDWYWLLLSTATSPRNDIH